MGLHGGPPKDLMIELQRAFSLRYFLETGTFSGATAAWAAEHFEQVTTVEGSPELHRAAAERHKHLHNIRFVQGDSRDVLPGAVSDAEGPILAWLDSHWSGGTTYGEHSECPLLYEIEVLRAMPHPPFLFIDDARLFVAPPPRPHKMDQWPTLTQVIRALTSGEHPLEVLLLDDTLVAIPHHAKELVWHHAQDVATRNWAQHQAAALTPPVIRGLRQIRARGETRQKEGPVSVLWLSYLSSARMGGQRNLLQLSKRLDPSKIQSWIVPPEEGELADEARRQGLIVEPCLRGDFVFRKGTIPTPRGSYRTLRRSMDLRALIKHSGAKIVYADAPPDVRHAWLATRGLDVRVLWHAQMSAPDPLWDAVNVQAADQILGVSEGVRERLRHLPGFMPERYKTIYNGVDTSIFRGEASQDAREQLFPGAPTEAVIGVYVGQISQSKGLDELIVAAAHISTKVPQLYLSFLGEGDKTYVDALKKKAAESGVRVHFGGFTHRLEHILPAAQFMVFPSYSEGLPLSVLEAMASGLPVVASDVTGNQDLIDATCGELVPVRRIEALAEAIVRQVSDGDRRRMQGAAAQKRAQNQFSLDRCVEHFQDALLALAEEPPRATGQALMAELGWGAR